MKNSVRPTLKRLVVTLKKLYFSSTQIAFFKRYLPADWDPTNQHECINPHKFGRPRGVVRFLFFYHYYYYYYHYYYYYYYYGVKELYLGTVPKIYSGFNMTFSNDNACCKPRRPDGRCLCATCRGAGGGAIGHHETFSPRVHVCRQCGRRCKTKQGLLAHIRAHNRRVPQAASPRRPTTPPASDGQGGGVHVCRQCGRRCKTKQGLLAHIRAHNRRVPQAASPVRPTTPPASDGVHGPLLPTLVHQIGGPKRRGPRNHGGPKRRGPRNHGGPKRRGPRNHGGPKRRGPCNHGSPVRWLRDRWRRLRRLWASSTSSYLWASLTCTSSCFKTHLYCNRCGLRTDAQRLCCVRCGVPMEALCFMCKRCGLPRLTFCLLCKKCGAQILCKRCEVRTEVTCRRCSFPMATYFRCSRCGAPWE